MDPLDSSLSMGEHREEILVVDHDSEELRLLSFTLDKEGYSVTTAADGISALSALTVNPDLILLDVMLAGIDGFEVLQQVKGHPSFAAIPVMLFSPKSNEADRVRGFELGAEDYVVKPFSVRELILRIRTLLTRVAKSRSPEVRSLDRIWLDLKAFEAVVGGRHVPLTMTEFHLLAYLLENRGRVITRRQLLNNVWGTSYSGTARTVDTHVQRLRDKLGAEKECLQTIRGIGYKIDRILGRSSLEPR